VRPWPRLNGQDNSAAKATNMYKHIQQDCCSWPAQIKTPDVSKPKFAMPGGFVRFLQACEMSRRASLIDLHRVCRAKDKYRTQIYSRCIYIPLGFKHALNIVWSSDGHPYDQHSDTCKLLRGLICLRHNGTSMSVHVFSHGHLHLQVGRVEVLIPGEDHSNAS